MPKCTLSRVHRAFLSSIKSDFVLSLVLTMTTRLFCWIKGSMVAVCMQCWWSIDAGKQDVVNCLEFVDRVLGKIIVRRDNRSWKAEDWCSGGRSSH